MLAISRPFCPRVSAFHRSFAAPVAAPAPDRRGPPTVAGQQAFARRDRTRLRLCRSKPLHENLYAPPWYQPGRLAATAGNCSEVVNNGGTGRHTSMLHALFDSNKQRMFPSYKSAQAAPLNVQSTGNF